MQPSMHPPPDARGVVLQVATWLEAHQGVTLMSHATMAHAAFLLHHSWQAAIVSQLEQLLEGEQRLGAKQRLGGRTVRMTATPAGMRLAALP